MCVCVAFYAVYAVCVPPSQYLLLSPSLVCCSTSSCPACPSSSAVPPHPLPSPLQYLLLESKASPNMLDKNDQTVRESTHTCMMCTGTHTCWMRMNDQTVHTHMFMETPPLDLLLPLPPKALHFACIGGYLDVCGKLIEQQAYVEVDTASNLQPLHFAALSGHTSIGKLLLQHGADINCLCAEDLQSPLHCAASRGHAEVVSLLIAKGAEVDIRNASNATPLHHAAMNNHIRVVEKLLEVKATCNTHAHHTHHTRAPHTRTHHTHPHAPVRGEQPSISPSSPCILIMPPLLQAHANPLAVAKNNWTPMLMAFRQGNTHTNTNTAVGVSPSWHSPFVPPLQVIWSVAAS